MEKKGNTCQAVPYQIIPLQNEIENTSILPKCKHLSKRKRFNRQLEMQKSGLTP
jgi:hypothetical protein